jgi:hypothetical protein
VINLMTALAARQEFQTRKPRSAPAYKDVFKKESLAPDLISLLVPQPDPFPLICKKAQCICCSGNKRLPYEEQTREFSRHSHMMDHVENVLLSKLPQVSAQFFCIQSAHRMDGAVFRLCDVIQNHVARTHKITLRAQPVSHLSLPYNFHSLI